MCVRLVLHLLYNRCHCDPFAMLHRSEILESLCVSGLRVCKPLAMMLRTYGVQFSFEGTFRSVAGRRYEHAQLQHLSGRLVNRCQYSIWYQVIIGDANKTSWQWCRWIVHDSNKKDVHVTVSGWMVINEIIDVQETVCSCCLWDVLFIALHLMTSWWRSNYNKYGRYWYLLDFSSYRIVVMVLVMEKIKQCDGSAACRVCTIIVFSLECLVSRLPRARYIGWQSDWAEWL
jgi:hypothetical protein